MKCKTCGFAASDPSVTVCPFCKPNMQGGAAVMAASANAQVWPPAPTSAPPQYVSSEGWVDREALLKQRKFGRMLSWIGFAAYMASNLFLRDHSPLGKLAKDSLILASLVLFIIGYGHYAASKGYARWIGWLLALPGFFGALILRVLPDKNKLTA